MLSPQVGQLWAVEVSLEENRAERGNIGYVDLQLLFRLYPETQKARQNFEEVVRQAEDQVNVRKAELIGLRAEAARARLERSLLTQSPPSEHPQARAAAQSATADASTAPAVAVSSAGYGSSSHGTTDPSPEETVGSSATAASGLPHLPGLAPEPGAWTPPPTSPVAAPPLAELERKLSEKTALLESKEAEFRTYQAQVEKNLLDLEERRTEILLGKIYAAVQAVARSEGISIVVDKGQILFGHKAVDLTERVLQRLKRP